MSLDIRTEFEIISYAIAAVSLLLEKHTIDVITTPEVKEKLYTAFLPFALKFNKDYFNDYQSDYEDDTTPEQFLIKWVEKKEYYDDDILTIGNNSLRKIIRILRS